VTRPLDLARLAPPWRRPPAPSVAPAESGSSAVTFPGVLLVCTVAIAPGADLTKPPSTWSWTDVTPYVRFDAGIATTQGRDDWTAGVKTSTGALTLDNRDGRFVRRNPLGPYYGLLTQNTPIWATIDPGSGPVTRMAQFVNEWPTRWDRSATDSTVEIACSGVMRRLSQGADKKSAIRRTLTGGAQPTPFAYYPMEDGSSATSVASGLSGGSPLRGTPVFGSAFGGSAGSIDLSKVVDGALFTSLTLPDAKGFQVEFVYTAPAGQTIAPIALYSGANLVGGGPTLTGDGLPHHYSVSYTQIPGGGIVFSEYSDGVLTNCAVQGLGVFTLASSLTIVVRNAAGHPGSLAHLTVYKFADVTAGAAFLGPPAIVAPLGSPATRALAANGYAGEQATDRMRRVAAEEGIQMYCPSGVSVAMGAQPVDTALNVFRDCETVDQGVLYEANWGLGYQSLDDRANQSVGMALDKNLGHIAVEPEPADDDQRIRNRWTVNRQGGSSVVVEQTSGPMGTQPGGPGVYDDSKTVNVGADTQLRDQAYWRLHLSTVDEDRWPNLPLRFHGTPDLIPAWLRLGFGARVTLANIAAQMTPDLIDAVIEGWAERWDPTSWEAVLNTSPYSPYRVSVMANTTGDTGEFLGWADFDSLALAAAVDTVATSWQVNASPLDTTLADDFPRDMLIAGERVTVTACSGGIADAFGRTASSSWGNADVGGAWNISGGTGTDYNVGSGVGTILMPTTNVGHNAAIGAGFTDFDATVSFKTAPGVFATGAPLLVSLVNRWGDANNSYQFRAQLETSGAVTALLIRRSGGSETTIASANVPGVSWSSDTFFKIRGQMAGNMLQVKIWPASGPEPFAWHASGSDSSALLAPGSVGVATMSAVGNTNVNPTISFDNFAATPPQIWTVTRSVNTVVKAHAAGETIALYKPFVMEP